MPYEALIAPIWYANPCNPEEIDDWPMDRVFRMLNYIKLQKEIQQELQGNG